jgi:putative DNA primase/helicase
MTTSSLKITPLEIALDYAARYGLPIFPVALIKLPDGKIEKRPLTLHGLKDATRDPHTIEAMWRAAPGAAIGMPTGIPSGINVLDVDCKDPRAYGPDTLADLGMPFLPVVPISHTISCGFHLLFGPNPEIDLRNSTGASGLGPGLDFRGSGGFVVLPSGTVAIRNGTNIEMSEGYWWDPHYNLDTTPLIPAPAWLGHRTKKVASATSSRHHHDGRRFDPVRLLDEACANIRNAAPGERHDTMNRHVFSVATLVGRDMLDKNLAWNALETATAVMVNRTAGNGSRHAHYFRVAFDQGFAEGKARPRWRARS